MTLNLDTVYLGDCLEVMKDIPDGNIDMILCDLPYGTTHCKWDILIPFEPLWEQYMRVIKDTGAIILFGCEPFSSYLRMSNVKLYRYDWIWEKSNATGHLNAKKMPLRAHENIMVFYKKLPIYNPQKTIGHKPVNSYTKCIETQNHTEIYGRMNKEISGGGDTDRYPRSVLVFASDKQRSYLHPTQKPVALLEYLIRTYTNEGDTVLDNCMGSGSTCIAAINTNRHYIGIEKEQRYFDIAQERIYQIKEQYMSEL